MSTYVGTARSQRDISLADLKQYFHSFAKSPSEYAIGLEWELFGVEPHTGRALPYSGPAGIESVLRFLQRTFGYQAIEEEGRAIALSKGKNYVALEPGGQLELSAAPVRTLHEMCNQLESFRKELCAVVQAMPVSWITVGFHPVSSLGELEWVPKKRYDIMRAYLISRGCQAHDMMKRTAANQVNVDFADEADAMEKMRVIYALTSLVSAMFAHSPFEEGRLTRYQTRRMAAWRETDRDRTGLPPAFLEEDAGIEDYLEYVLRTPMIFIIRDHRWIPMEGTRFGDYLGKGFQGFRATMEDWELHLSTLFPEARIKNCIEIRGADGQMFDLIPAVAALWKGVLYEETSRKGVWEILKSFSWPERQAFHVALEKQGPRAFLGKYRGWDLVREIVPLAEEGLRLQEQRDAWGNDERIYLQILKEKIVKPEKTPAEILKERWERETKQDPMALTKILSLSCEDWP